ncbi:hypothetical protein J5X84_40520 [Streptosporangiaceae bacterium NEAU-GS5]|nr:hypothetical protein [Streptosporangiaceae bacterium NEAU-GS5]
MKRIAVALMAGAVGGALLLTGSATATAQAAPTISFTSVPANGTISVSERPARARLELESDAAEVTLTATAPNGNTMAAKSPRGFHHGTTWSFRLTFTSSDPIGDWTVNATGKATDGSTTTVTTHLFVYGATRIVNFRARPSVVRQGHQITVSGRLLTFDGHRWQPVTTVQYEHVRIYFVRGHKPYGSDPVQVADVVTDAHGRFYANVEATYSGFFYAFFTTYDGATTNSSNRHLASTNSKRVFVKVFGKRRVVRI